MRKIMSEFLNIGEKSYYVWKNKSHIELINFIETYFTEEELKEWLETGKMQKLEKNNNNTNLDEFILSTATHKIINKTTPSIWKKEVLPKKMFVKILKNVDEKNIKSFIAETKKIKIDLLESENWKKIIINFVKNEMSEIEIQKIIENKNKVIEALQ